MSEPPVTLQELRTIDLFEELSDAQLAEWIPVAQVYLAPFGLHLRLKASTDLSKATPQALIVLTALQKYGMFLADIGSDWYIGGAPDMGWDDDDLGFIKGLTGSDFEVLTPGPLTSNCD